MVVSNTSPVANLAAIGHLDLLRELYGVVLIPEAVRLELIAAPQVAIALEPHDWIHVCRVENRGLLDSLATQLHAGEAEAIVLASDREADLLLMDERRGRRIASRLGVKPIGLLGVILEAKSKNLIPAVRPLLDALVAQAGFWVGRDLYERVLAEASES